METSQNETERLLSEAYDMGQQLTKMGEECQYAAMAKVFADGNLADAANFTIDTVDGPAKPKVGMHALAVDYHKRLQACLIGCSTEDHGFTAEDLEEAA